MEAAIGVGAARWVVDRVLEPITIGLLEPWAASSALGTKIHDIKLELLYAQGMLDNAHGRDIRSPALAQLLLELRQLAYIADDVIDELEYFRIQDELNGTYENMDPEGLKGLLVHAQHTVKTHARWLKLPSCKEQEDGEQGCLSGACGRCGRNTQDADGGCMGKVASSLRAVGKRLPCYSLPCTSIWPSNALKFDRVGMSKKMSDIVDQLKPLCAKVSTILSLELVGFNRTTMTETPFIRPKTTSEIIEPEIHGREQLINDVIRDITSGKYSSKNLTVLPIFGLGGIGKTHFTQHVYNNNKVKTHFHVRIWISVSHNFNANRLARDILKQIPRDSDGSGTEEISKVLDEEGTAEHKTGKRTDEKGTAEEIIKKAIHSERFLLVLDDIWRCPDDEWKKLLAPFRSGGKKGNTIIVTTRFLGVAKAVESTGCSIEIDHLEPEYCMSLFKECVFGDQRPWKDHHGLRRTGEEIVKMLKGSPLAIKTVGRLLRTQLNIDHWTNVLESKEWEHQTSHEDIMPALTLSYNYLPFPVQQCFSYCGLLVNLARRHAAPV